MLNFISNSFNQVKDYGFIELITYIIRINAVSLFLLSVYVSG